MTIIENICRKAQSNPARIVFPESDNESILKVAYRAADLGILIPVFVGQREEINKQISACGLEVGQHEIVDVNDSDYRQDLINRYNDYPHAIFKGASLEMRLSDPMYLALVMTALDEVDAFFAGADHSTGEVILASQTILGLQEGIKTVSSCGFMDIPGFSGAEGQLLAFADSAVCQNPNAEELAGIAISACDTVESLFGWTPRCAMLSYSTLSSGEGVLVDKVKEAVKIANTLRPDLIIDGEFQLDTAINPEVAKKKVKRESQVAGQANIVVFPDLNAGNIGVKLVQQFAKADAYGPLITGINKTVSDCSRNAPESEMLGNLAITSVRAMN